MSLIYNSLKQHEKKADSQQKINPISQRMRTREEEAFSKTSFGLVVLGVTLACIIGLFILQKYWGYQAKEEERLPFQDKRVNLVESQGEIKKDVIHDSSINKIVARVDESIEVREPDSILVAEISNEDEARTDVVAVDVLDDTKHQNIEPHALQASMATVDKGVNQSPVVKKTESKPTNLMVEVNSQFEKNSNTKTVSTELEAIQPKVESDESYHVRDFSFQKTEKEHVISVAKADKLPVKQVAVVVTKVEKTPKPISAKVVENKLVDKSHITPFKKIPLPKKEDVTLTKVEVVKSNETPVKNSVEYFMAVKTKVAEIKQSIQLKSDKEVQSNLNELERLSGKDSVIYQRMNAYASLKNQRYQAAVNSYQKLLSQKPEDMEANMNLVIALAELGDQQTAKQQLNRLDSLYPESSQLRLYKKMIHAKYGY
ncbi:hypothetical protein THMIRHAM_20940 [Thiomicrorhabdus immobilis]|uniref:Tetratricopeptide repeat protein n=1 Tax=Thiomicrorhabdus immobilis TaxID=2791037 RepID=A0ABM7MFW3_9GAMM|nr:tetratricopeptide repeat protein [Thiomicrorhabdus immobilis]BCN94309.1 hypothetical protein THMIRHAM_20940 [Thiomicrorhabdus immobilis]